MKPSPEYRAWQKMKARCYNPNDKSFKHYGQRGLLVYPEWHTSFDSFLKHIGPRPSDKHSLDRIDVNGHYWPGNVRWATNLEQQNNMRRNLRVTYNGKTLTLPEWSRLMNIDIKTLYRRHCVLKWEPHRTFTAPLGKHTRCIDFGGRSLRLCDWAREIGITPKALSERINGLGWSVEKALRTPPKFKPKDKK
jgi:hypothetical protein